MMINPAFFADEKPNATFSQEEQGGEVCIANISPYERRKRVSFAYQLLAVTLVLLAVLILLDLSPLWRLLLFFPFSAAAVGFFQALDKT